MAGKKKSKKDAKAEAAPEIAAPAPNAEAFESRAERKEKAGQIAAPEAENSSAAREKRKAAAAAAQ